jgi:hypothetical protein
MRSNSLGKLGLRTFGLIGPDGPAMMCFAFSVRSRKASKSKNLSLLPWRRRHPGLP